MPTAGATIFIDTNAIEAAHRHHCWNALRKNYQLCTVGICLEEATRPNKAGHTLTNKTLAQLSTELSCVPVGPAQELALMAAIGGLPSLNAGEKSLLAAAYGLGSTTAWLLCGPDKATLVAMSRLKLADRMVSLEQLATGVGHRFRGLERQYGTGWLQEKRTQLLLGNELI